MVLVLERQSLRSVVALGVLVAAIVLSTLTVPATARPAPEVRTVGVVATPFRLAGSEAGNVKLRWTTVAGATAYDVMRSTSQTGGWSTVGRAPGDTLDDYDLPAGSAYFYQVRAVDGSGAVVGQSPPVRTTTPQPGSSARTFDNTRSDPLVLKSTLEADGIYYRYDYQADGAGFSQLVQRTSTDGYTFTGSTVVLSRGSDPRLASVKLEALGVVKNPATGRFVLWAHLENAADYSLAQVAVAEAVPGAAFRFVDTYRPLGHESRDLTFFADDDGTAYLVSATNQNSDLNLYRLSADWLTVVEKSATLFAGQHREGPSMVKVDGTYYLFTSEAAGWYPSQGMYASAPSPTGPWSELRPAGSTATYGAQSGGIVKIGDRYAMVANRWGAQWQPPEAANSQRVLPISFNQGYAAYEYFPQVGYDETRGVVPVQSGRILSVGKPVTASGVSTDTPADAVTYAAGRAADGVQSDKANYYKSDKVPFSWEVDLQSPSVLDRITLTTKLVNGSETSYAYTIDASSDRTAYTRIVDASGNRAVGFGSHQVTTTTPLRYVRVTVTRIVNIHNGNAADWARGVGELTVYGHSAGQRAAASGTAFPVGKPWPDTSGRQLQTHGGNILQHGGWYYWVGENKSDNTAHFAGVSLYKSQDLRNWMYVKDIFTPAADPAVADCILERPKLLYDAATGTFVLWAHWERPTDYAASHLLVATSSTIDGDYVFQRHFRPGVGHVTTPDPDPTYTGGDNLWGYGSRDFTVFQDGPNGAAYLVSSQDSSNMRVYKLTAGLTDVDWASSYQLFAGQRREAPALVKVGEYYFVFTSSQSGWYPNQAMYAVTRNIADPAGWSALRPVGNNTTYYSQPTSILPITTTSGVQQYVYLGDHWNPKALGTSTYVWLPLRFAGTSGTGTPTVSMNYQPAWSIDPVTREIVSTPAELVSQGKPVEAASASTTYPPSAANDGNLFNLNSSGDNTNYYLPPGVPFTWTVDLQQQQELSRVDLSFRSYNGSETYSGYTVEGSNDKATWTTLVNNTANKTVGFTSEPVTGRYRYVRVSVATVVNDHNGNAAAWAAGLVEVQVYRTG